MNLIYNICVILGSCFLLVIGSELDYDGWVHLRLYHALNNHPVPYFIERGNVTITSIRNGQSTITQIGLQPSQLTDLKTLAEHGLKYRLKVVARSSLGTETTFFTSVPACHLLGTEIEDILITWLDAAGELISVTQVSPGPCSVSLPTTNMWMTSIQIRFSDSGLMPDTASYIFKLEKEKEAKERGEVKDHRSFLSKYWMYIVPALIFVVLTSAANPDGVAGTGGATSQRQ